MKRLINYFLKGLLVFVPAALTIFIFIWAFTSLDKLFAKATEQDKLPFPGLGLIITLAVITLIGFLASNFIGKKIFEILDKIFTKLPLAKLLYSATKDVLEAFTGERKSFDQPVIVDLTAYGPKAMGFITRESLESLNLAGHIAVYFPQSYNFAGSVLIFPSDRVVPIEIDNAEAMKFIVSGGVSGKLPGE